MLQSYFAIWADATSAWVLFNYFLVKFDMTNKEMLIDT